MKLKFLFEDQDYGSCYMDQRDVVRGLEAKLERLEGELRDARQPADLRDFESDKDRGGGSQYLKRAIVKVERALGAERMKLQELKELWDAVRSKVGE